LTKQAPKKKTAKKKAVKKPLGKQAGPLPEFIDKESMSKLFKVSIRQIERWEVDGCPVDRSGRKNLYDLSKVISWRHAQIQKSELSELDLEKIREMTAKADLRELEVAEKMGNLLPVDLIGSAWSSILSSIKTAFRGLVSDLKIHDPKIKQEKLDFLKRRIDEILTGLSNEDTIPRQLIKAIDKLEEEFNTSPGAESE
jgi:phage terminase Nu1 subunit (DNA packaging protein)